jgi:hypothetical protein
MDAVSVQLTWPDFGQEDVPDVIVAFLDSDSCGLRSAGRFEEAQLHPHGVL